MTKADWVDVGLRVLGVFFIVSSLAALWRTGLVLAAATGRGVGDASLGGIALLIPLVEIVGGIMLLFIRWPGDASGNRSRSKPLPDYLEDSLEKMERGDAGTPKNE